MSGNAAPLLHEIAALLDRLALTGEGGSVQLNGLPLQPGDYEALQEALGEGEVSAEIQALGPSLIRETALHGVWWATHRNALQEVVAESIEVTRCPALLQTPAEDVAEAARILRERLSVATKGEHDV
ncbi:MAG: hydrogenase expression/formation protein [Sulfuricella denitrificans]|nr:hydrogenase expression/formation protein [Sulfuricella denitrificans]